MLLKYFYDEALAHASYLVGGQKTGEAIVIDPDRSIGQYLDAANQEGMTIVGTAETHIHADYVSGSRELADAPLATPSPASRTSTGPASSRRSSSSSADWESRGDSEV
jgi:hydroxyacylglutathione hydrolase